jgi:hypothetical protein
MIRSPIKILKLWNKINDRFGPVEAGDDKIRKGEKKKVSDTDKAAEKQNTKITRGLTALKVVAKAGVTTPSQVKKFETTRDRVVLVMKKYCKTIKSARLEGAQDMNKFRKSVKQLTIVVEGLTAGLVDAADEGDEEIGALAGIDDGKFDQAMEDPNFAAAADNFSFDDIITEAPPTEEKLAPAAAEPKELNGVMARLNVLNPQYLQAIKLNGPDVPQMKTMFQIVSGFLKDKNLEQAEPALSDLEMLVNKALAVPPAVAASPKDLGVAMKGWQTARVDVINSLRKLETAIQKDSHPQGLRAIVLLESICKQLTLSPDTLPKIKAVESYLQSDDIIGAAEEPNRFGIAVKIRQPLLNELQGLKTFVPA